MMWLEWRQLRWTLLVLTALAALLGAAYAAHIVRGAPPFALVRELGPWADGASCTLYTGLLKDLESTCKVTMLFAGRWFDWWAPLLSTFVAALFGSRLISGLAFLQLQPLPASHLLLIRLSSGLAALTLTVLVSALFVSSRGALNFSWWPAGEIMQSEFWLGTLLVWLRGLCVLLLAGCLTQVLPASVAALIAIVSSLALLGLEFDPFVRNLTLVYSPEQFGALAQREVLPLDVVQGFIISHPPARLELGTAPAAWWWLGLALLMLSVLTSALFSRPRTP